MWYIILTGPNNEQKAKLFFEYYMKEGIIDDIYLPLRRDPDKGTIRHSIPGIIFINAALNDKSPLLSPSGGILDYLPKSIGQDMEPIPMPYRLYHQFNHQQQGLAERLGWASVTDGQLQQLRFYNDNIVGGADEIRVLSDISGHVTIEALEKTKNVVTIVDGPFIGLTGYLKQVKQKNRKDHKLIIHVGKMLLQLASVRKYHHIILREPAGGNAVNKARIWQHIDAVIGTIQAMGHPDDAHDILASIITHIKGNDVMERINAIQESSASVLADERDILNALGADNEDLLNILEAFCVKGGGAQDFLKQTIPDSPLRPFLTPTSGIAIPGNAKQVSLQHRDFTEFITRIKLTPFLGKGTSASSLPKYYYSHIAVYHNGDGSVDACVNWGELIALFMTTAKDDVSTLVDTPLFQQEFPTLASILPTLDIATPRGFAPNSIIRMHLADGDPSPAIAFFNTTLVKAAVEIWQSTRYLQLRDLLKRYVLLQNP